MSNPPSIPEVKTNKRKRDVSTSTPNKKAKKGASVDAEDPIQEVDTATDLRGVGIIIADDIVDVEVGDEGGREDVGPPKDPPPPPKKPSLARNKVKRQLLPLLLAVADVIDLTRDE